MSASITAYIGLGANLNHPLQTLKKVLYDLNHAPAITLTACSSFYDTSPVDCTGPDYVNAVASLRTTLNPYALLHILQNLEHRYGRERPYRNAPRTLDLDLLLYGDWMLNDPLLTLPHPRLHERAFVLVPLKEIAPSLKLMQGAMDTLITRALETGQQIHRLKPPYLPTSTA